MRKTTVSATAAIALALTLGLSACSDDDTDAATDTVTSAASDVTEAASDAGDDMTGDDDEMTAEKDIVETAQDAGDFETLTTALTEAGLVETLQGEGPFTVFAPTDAAFEKLPDGTLDTLLETPEGDLKQILTYHVVATKAMAADLTDGQELATVNGGNLTVKIDGDNVMLMDAQGGTATVTSADIEASNGVIHVIDTVVMP